MDELADVLAGSFSVTSMTNSTAAPHPRFSQYKMKSTGVTQEDRRKKYLELQKQLSHVTNVLVYVCVHLPVSYKIHMKDLKYWV